MIQEAYCSFEVAKLLKEKGFDWSCYGRYSVRSKEFHLDCTKPCNNGGNFMYSAPTQQMAMKWLRKVHGLHIDVFVGMDESHDADGVMVDEWNFWTYRITTTTGEIVYDAYDQFDVVEHQTYEEAAENAILFCLNNLI